MLTRFIYEERNEREQMITGADLAILDLIRAHMTSPLGDEIMPVITMLGDNGIIWIIMGAVMLLFKRTRKLGAAMAIALVIDVVCCNFIIKPLVARIRPFDVNTAIKLIISAPDDYSFPSGHTAAAFAAFGALFFGRKKLTGSPNSFIGMNIYDDLSRHNGSIAPVGVQALNYEEFGSGRASVFSQKNLWIPVLVLAILIAASRLYLYVHYPTDVLAGMLLGILFGFIGANITAYLWKARILKSSKRISSR